MSGKIKAITFDIWDTIFINDSDEPKRQSRGLESKALMRRTLVHQYLHRHNPVSKGAVNLAYNVVDAAFREVWYGQSVTWTVQERLLVLLKGLKRELPKSEMDELVKHHEEMELEISPEIAPGIVDAIKALSKDYKLGVISDAIFSPGRVLREILKKHDLLQYFSTFVFSDEVNCSKPDPRMFEVAAKGLGVELSEIVHIGDREKKDVEGAHLVGAKAIYTTVVLNRGDDTKAEAHCSNYSELKKIVDQLSQTGI